MSGEDLELKVERLIDAPVDAVWRAWTEHLAEWWCPEPWTTEIVALDLRAGGRWAMVMRGPDGEEHAIEGVFLEIVPERRVVFTDAYRADWVPATPFMTGIMAFAPEGGRTRYVGSARHWTAEACAQHKTMGFSDGWGKVAAQLEAVARRVAAASGG